MRYPISIDYITSKAKDDIYTCYFDIINHETGKQINNGSCSFVYNEDIKIQTRSVICANSLINPDHPEIQMLYAGRIKGAIKARFALL